jgi:hypothetical protein
LPPTPDAPATPETETEAQQSPLTNHTHPPNAPEGEAAERPLEEAAPTKDAPRPKSLKALAETLKLADKDLYDIEVPMSNGESRTLGQLKDLVSKQDDFTLRELSFEEERQRKESDLHRAQNELRELVSQLPKNALRPEVVEAFRQKHEATVQQERQRTLEVIPEWKDEARRTEEITGIVEHLESYGFPKNYLSSVVDHRTIKYIRENFLREKRLRSALEQVKVAPPSNTARSRSQAQAPKKGGVQAPGHSRDKLASIFSTLK